ncbi:hypothetical protein RHSIM_Rhsim11G0033300 [Rhododendron simsii]|uniref:MATH domain-containing protein n=1 Tax=Rhododendron simsii TaxID=118357 RepID=A0A834G784_RHOSS|nr:hypothetical protein RHSIM_Rhsim11G0033300 [Rhododendron simsii]
MVEIWHPILDDNSEVATMLGDRDITLARYTIKIETFSALSEMMLDTKVQKYETDLFEASGQKWKLSLYPTGDKERNGDGYISLYLVIAETDNLPLGWEVMNVYFKLFVFDKIQDKYMNFQGNLYGNLIPMNKKSHKT